MKIAMTIAAAALVSGAAAEARQRLVTDIFCLELQRVVDAAQYEGGFVQLQRSRSAPPRFGFERGCQAYAKSWWCHQNLAPDHLSFADLSAKTSACFPDAVREPDRWSNRSAVFALPHAQIRIEEHGGPRAHVGRIVTFSVEMKAAD